MKRKQIIAAIGVAVALIGGTYFFGDTIGRNVMSAYAHITGQSEAPLHESEGRYVRQIVAQNNSTSRTIMWQSDISEDGAIVEYRVANSSDIKSVNATNRAFTDDGTTSYIHEATIAELTPNTTYEYRVGYGNKRSNWYKLTTAGAHDYQVLIYPDSQSADYSGWAKLVKDSVQRNPNAALYVSMGDLVDNGEQASQWRAWFNSIEPLASRTAFAPLMGNHETYNLDWKVREPVAYTNYFTLPSNGNDEYKNRYYSYDFGDVHYVVLDTQFKEAEGFHDNLRDDEVAWLRQDLANNTKKWTVVLMHKDSIRYKNTKTNWEPGINDIGETFMPIFDEFNVDVVLSAHYHTYRNRGHIRNFERNESGPLYIITGVAGDVRYQNLWINHPLDVVVAPQPETDNYMTMDVSENKLTLNAFLSDGTQIDSVSVTK